MPDPQQQNQNQPNEPKSDLSREDLERAIKKVFGEIRTEEDLRRSVQAYIEKKTEELSEEGKELYLNLVRSLPLEPDKTPQEVIDSVDDKLKLLKEKFPANADNQQNQDQTQDQNQDQNQTQPQVEPQDRSQFVVDKDDKDKLPEEMQPYGTLEGYVQQHNKRYNQTKNINLFKKPASS